MRKGLMLCRSRADARVLLLLTLFPNDDPNVTGDNCVLIIITPTPARFVHDEIFSVTVGLVTLANHSLVLWRHSYRT